MRVIGGTARGRVLKAPKGDKVRPTADRVREAMFDVLSSLDVVRGATVVDLFAGTGALGIEAASWGASFVTFVEIDRLTATLIEENLVRTGLADIHADRVVVGDALGYGPRSTAPVDLALIDPPYRFAEWPKLLEGLRAEVVVCESAKAVALGDHYELHREYRYGTTLVTVATSRSHGATEDRS